MPLTPDIERELEDMVQQLQEKEERMSENGEIS